MPLHAVARRGDPSTSWAAANSLYPETLRRTLRLVLHTIQDRGPMTDEHLVDLLEGAMSPSGARSRRAELVDLGLVYDTGQRLVLRSGRRAIVWAARWMSPEPLPLWGQL